MVAGLDPRRRISTRGPLDGVAAPELADDTGMGTAPTPGPKMPTEITNRPDGMVPTVSPTMPKPKLSTPTTPGAGPRPDTSATGLTPSGDVAPPPGSRSELRGQLSKNPAWQQAAERRNGLMPSRAGRPAPVAYDREGKPIQGVSGRLDTMLRRDNPYIQRARTAAAQAANRRGLQSSSIAAGAGEAAAIDAALPIAQVDASIAQAERGMRAAEFMQAEGHRVQQYMQKFGLDHQAAQNELQRQHAELLQYKQIRSAELMQQRGLDHATAEAKAQREFAGRQASLDRETQKLMQQRGFSHDRARQEAQNRFAGRQAEADRILREKIADKTLTAEQARHEAELELRRTTAVQSGIQHAEAMHRQSVDRILANPDLDEDTTQAAIEASRAQFAGARRTYAAMHDVELPATTRPTPAPEPEPEPEPEPTAPTPTPAAPPRNRRPATRPKVRDSHGRLVDAWTGQ